MSNLAIKNAYTISMVSLYQIIQQPVIKQQADKRMNAWKHIVILSSIFIPSEKTNYIKLSASNLQHYTCVICTVVITLQTTITILLSQITSSSVIFHKSYSAMVDNTYIINKTNTNHSFNNRGRSGRERMVVRFTTTYAINAYHQ